MLKYLFDLKKKIDLLHILSFSTVMSSWTMGLGNFLNAPTYWLLLFEYFLLLKRQQQRANIALNTMQTWNSNTRVDRNAFPICSKDEANHRWVWLKSTHSLPAQSSLFKLWVNRIYISWYTFQSAIWFSPQGVISRVQNIQSKQIFLLREGSRSV